MRSEAPLRENCGKMGAILHEHHDEPALRVLGVDYLRSPQCCWLEGSSLLSALGAVQH